MEFNVDKVDQWADLVVTLLASVLIDLVNFCQDLK